MKKLISIALFLASISASALTVYDPANFAKNLETSINTAKQIQNQAQQLLNEAKMIDAQMKHLLSLPQTLTNYQLSALQQNLNGVVNIQRQAKSLINDYSNFQNQFKNVFIDFASFDNMTPDDYISHSNRLRNELNSSFEDSMRISGIGNYSKLSDDNQRIQQIMSAANKAEGQKEVLQASSQLSAMNIELLTELRTLTAQSLKAQSSEMGRQLQEEAMKKAREEKAMTKNVNVDGMDSGILNLKRGS